MMSKTSLKKVKNHYFGHLLAAPHIEFLQIIAKFSIVIPEICALGFHFWLQF